MNQSTDRIRLSLARAEIPHEVYAGVKAGYDHWGTQDGCYWDGEKLMLHPLSSAAIWTHEIGHYFTSQQLDTFHLVNYGLDELNRFHDELESKTCHWTFYLLDLIGESREAKWDMANCNFDVDEYEKWVAQGELVHLELVENEQYQKFYNKLKEVTE